MHHINFDLIYLTLVVVLIFIVSATCISADVVFLSDRDGSVPTYECDVYTMDDTGGNVHRLTKDLLYKAKPAWSPNGSQIAFAVEVIKARQKDWEPDQTVELFVINANGSGKKQLTDYKGITSNPTWSPDGRSIAFVSSDSGNLEIHRMDLDSGRVFQITNSFAETGGGASAPDWSPDGKKIVYSLSLPGAGRQIYIIDVDGGNPRPLVKPRKLEIGISNWDTGAKWHPDSEHILYRESLFTIVQDGAAARFEIVGKGALVIRREGSQDSQELKIPDELAFRTGCWAEGGNVVIFYASDNGNPGRPADIYRYDMFTHEIANISNHPGHDFSPHWVNPIYPVSSVGMLSTQWARLKKKNQ